jgi:hypothetical protein
MVPSTVPDCFQEETADALRAQVDWQLEVLDCSYPGDRPNAGSEATEVTFVARRPDFAIKKLRCVLLASLNNS